MVVKVGQIYDDLYFEDASITILGEPDEEGYFPVMRRIKGSEEEGVSNLTALERYYRLREEPKPAEIHEGQVWRDRNDKSWGLMVMSEPDEDGWFDIRYVDGSEMPSRRIVLDAYYELVIDPKRKEKKND